jgi:phosphoserine phosphatase
MTLPRTPDANAARVEAAIARQVDESRGRPVFLVDGDRTLSPDDTSRTFLARAGLDPLVIKRRFQRDGYVFDAFRFHAEVHVALGEAVFATLAPEVARETPVHPGAMDFLRDASARGPVFVVSAGIPRIWRCLLDLHGLGDVGVIGGIDPRDPFVFGRVEKGLVARRFRASASRLIALGDSEVDADMLGLAHHAVVVVNRRRNADLLPQLVGHPDVRQVVPEGEPHPSIPVVRFDALSQLASPPSPLVPEAHPCP